MTTQSLWVFIITQNGVEQIMTWLNENDKPIPLVYLSYQSVLDDNMIPCIEKMAKERQLFCELREYKYEAMSVQKFYPHQTEYNA